MRSTWTRITPRTPSGSGVVGGQHLAGPVQPHDPRRPGEGAEHDADAAVLADVRDGLCAAPDVVVVLDRQPVDDAERLDRPFRRHVDVTALARGGADEEERLRADPLLEPVVDGFEELPQAEAESARSSINPRVAATIGANLSAHGSLTAGRRRRRGGAWRADTCGVGDRRSGDRRRRHRRRLRVRRRAQHARAGHPDRRRRRRRHDGREARAVLAKARAASPSVPVVFVAGGRSWKIRPYELGVTADWHAAVAAALHRGGGFAFVRGYRRLRAALPPSDVTPRARAYDAAVAYKVGVLADAIDRPRPQREARAARAPARRRRGESRRGAPAERAPRRDRPRRSPASRGSRSRCRSRPRSRRSARATSRPPARSAGACSRRRSPSGRRDEAAAHALAARADARAPPIADAKPLFGGAAGRHDFAARPRGR